jgi:hypothetical protein
MSATARVSQTVNFGAGSIGGTVALLENDLIEYVEVSLLASGERQVDVVVDVSAVQLYAIEADQDCTVRTNDDSGGTPTDTIALKAKQPLIWRSGDPNGRKFLGGVSHDTDITALYVTVGGEDTTVKFGALIDATTA